MFVTCRYKESAETKRWVPLPRQAVAPLANKSVDLPADEISETPVYFSSVKK